MNAAATDAGSSQIKAEIGRTRRNMVDTLDELNYRLSPRNVGREFLAAFSGGVLASAGRDFGVKSWRAVARFPIPATLIGAGVAWLIYEGAAAAVEFISSGREQSRRGLGEGDESDASAAQAGTYSGACVEGGSERAYPRERGFLGRSAQRLARAAGIGERGGSATAQGSQVRESQYAGADAEGTRQGTSSGADSARAMTASVRERAMRAASAARQRAKAWALAAGECAKDVTSRFGHGLSRAATSAGETMRQSAATAGRQVRHGYGASRDAVAKTTDEYPISVGLGLLGLGLLLGLSLPHTRREDRLLGSVSEGAIVRARAKGRQLLERGCKVATATARAAAEEARTQGLTAQVMSEKAKKVAHKAQEAAREVASHGGHMQPNSRSSDDKD